MVGEKKGMEVSRKSGGTMIGTALIRRPNGTTMSGKAGGTSE